MFRRTPCRGWAGCIGGIQALGEEVGRLLRRRESTRRKQRLIAFQMAYGVPSLLGCGFWAGRSHVIALSTEIYLRIGSIAVRDEVLSHSEKLGLFCTVDRFTFAGRKVIPRSRQS